MDIRAPAIVCASRPYGETAAIVRLMTAEHGMVAGYVAGARGRALRPVLIPGNLVDAQLKSRSESRLPFARVELVRSRGSLLSEPLPAAAINWVTALAASALPERQPFPALYQSLEAVLEAICVAPSARGWAVPLLSFEVLLIAQLGYGEPVRRPEARDWPAMLRTFDMLGRQLQRYPLADRHGDVMASRLMLRERLARIEDG